MVCSHLDSSLTVLLLALLTIHLTLFAGVKSYEVSLESQTATVVAGPDLPFQTVLEKIAKTGKKVNSGEVDGVEHSIELPVA